MCVLVLTEGRSSICYLQVGLFASTDKKISCSYV